MEQPSSPRPSAVEISSSPPRRRRPSNAQAGPSGTRKRRRLTNQTVSSSASQPEIADETIAIDLTDVDGHSAIAKVLAKQREDAVTAQQPDNDTGSARTKLTGYKCPVCMDTPTDATTTVCGHLFCHQCIVEALKIGEERADNAGKTARGTCPVCRKPLARQDSPGPRRTLVPLEIRLTTKKKSAVAQPDVS